VHRLQSTPTSYKGFSSDIPTRLGLIEGSEYSENRVFRHWHESKHIAVFNKSKCYFVVSP